MGPSKIPAELRAQFDALRTNFSLTELWSLMLLLPDDAFLHVLRTMAVHPTSKLPTGGLLPNLEESFVIFADDRHFGSHSNVIGHACDLVPGLEEKLLHVLELLVNVAVDRWYRADERKLIAAFVMQTLEDIRWFHFENAPDDRVAALIKELRTNPIYKGIFY